MTPSGQGAIAMGYTGASQIQRVTAGSSSFTYSALGLAIETNGSGTTYYTRDNRGVLTEERAPGGNYYYLYDGLGSVVALTDSTGAVKNTYSYDPYGQILSRSETVTNPWKFGGSYGAYTDSSTGLIKIGCRYYDTGLGRWTQQDPVPGANRYAYAADNPINLIDPNGLSTADCVSLAAGVVGLAAILGSVVLAPETAAALLVVSSAAFIISAFVSAGEQGDLVPPALDIGYDAAALIASLFIVGETALGATAAAFAIPPLASSAAKCFSG